MDKDELTRRTTCAEQRERKLQRLAKRAGFSRIYRSTHYHGSDPEPIVEWVVMAHGYVTEERYVTSLTEDEVEPYLQERQP
jgi:hypothetical protein